MLQNAHILSPKITLVWDSTGWPSWAWALKGNDVPWNAISACVLIRNITKREIIGEQIDKHFTFQGSQDCAFQCHSHCCTDLKVPTNSYLGCSSHFLQLLSHLSPLNCLDFVDWNIWMLTVGAFSLTKTQVLSNHELCVNGLTFTN